MSEGSDVATAGRPVGVFQRFGEFVVRRPLVVIALWIAVAAALTATLPTLQQMVRERPVDLLPADAPVMQTTRQMTASFDETGSQNIMLVVLTDEDGLTPDDEQVYGTLVDTLRRESADVTSVQDFLATPPLRDVLASKDGKAWYVPVVLAGELGTPRGYDAYTHVAGVVKAATADAALTTNLTGPAATVADLTDVGERDLHQIEIATAVMVLLILLLVYRNPVTMTLPLATIGLSLLIAQDMVAGLAKLGLGISNQTITFMTAMMVGAGVDYAVFLISRYHEYLRSGIDSDRAVVRALESIGKVIAASAATVAVTFLGMSFTRLGLFATTGPALALSIAVAFLAAVTLLPALLVLTGRRGWIKPRRDLTTRFWRRSGINTVRRPTPRLVASLLVLLILAGCAGLLRFNYDDRKTLPADSESNLGYAAMDRHFALNSTIPQYIYIESPHDLRSPQALADLEQMAQRVSQLPNIEAVRGITRPTGQSLEQARVSYQAGEVGGKLSDASGLIDDRRADLDLLTNGANEMATNLGDIRGGVNQALSSVRGLVDALSYMENEFGGDRTLGQLDSADKLVAGMRALGNSIGLNLGQVTDTFGWAGPVLTALNASPLCDADPSCRDSRAQLQRLVTARDDGTLTDVAELARQLQSTQGDQTLGATARDLRRVLDTASRSLQRLGLDDSAGVQAKLTELQQGADTLADASRRLADGVQLLVDQTRKMGAGLTDASAFLLAMKQDAAKPSMSGFYIPPQVLGQREFKDAAAVFISPDGHAVRYLVQTELSPFSTEAMDQLEAIQDTAASAQPNTALADASISTAGFTATLRDIRDYYERDIAMIVVLTILVVLLILTVLLRAIVAPLYLVGSVIVSFLSALGIGVLFFQVLLGQELSWSVPGMAFIVLVAVGADYNLLLISRIRDESPHGIRSGVIRTVGSTGGVITSAGVIFAASMFGLLFGGIATMVQAGFIIGVGLLLDTFLVRTITVPALTVLIGEKNWWPSEAVAGRLAAWRARRAGDDRATTAI
ncbi:RND family transporter [Mycobacterium sp. NPDC050551]|uniref:MMPL/RND family transporter n=1 Tax=Mycobacterium sp. NPDC050551 TaxID=3155407 RepID=UPI0034122B86